MNTLSPKAQQLLAMVCESAGEPHYTEYEPEGYKPWLPVDVATLVDKGLVDYAEDSDTLPAASDLRYCDPEELDGVALLVPTEAGLAAARELKLL